MENNRGRVTESERESLFAVVCLGLFFDLCGRIIDVDTDSKRQCSEWDSCLLLCHCILQPHQGFSVEQSNPIRVSYKDHRIR